LREFLKFVADDPLYPLWHLLAMTGMRRGEALGLRWADVDLDAGHLAVRQTVVVLKGKFIASQPKTARGRRVLALDPGTVAVLKKWKGWQTFIPSELVFPGPDGGFLGPQVATSRFAKLARDSALPRIRLHDLRHTHATLALQAGVHPKIVSERLGHASISFTLDIYSHALSHMQTEAAQQIASLVFE
jgi:integrase